MKVPVECLAQGYNKRLDGLISAFTDCRAGKNRLPYFGVFGATRQGNLG